MNYKTLGVLALTALANGFSGQKEPVKVEIKNQITRTEYRDRIEWSDAYAALAVDNLSDGEVQACIKQRKQ